MITTEELKDELDSFNPKWKEHYKRLPDACKAAGIDDLLEEWYSTPEGVTYLELHSDVHDYMADNEARKAQMEAEQNMLTRNREIAAKGYLEEGDEV